MFPLRAICEALKVSVSGFRAWTKRPKSVRQKENETLLSHLRSFFKSGRGVYGSPRLWQDCLESKPLQKLGICPGRHRVARLMRQAGLKAMVAPKFVVTTDSKHEMPVAENLLNREFGAADANTKWASDITYIWTREGWLYLSVVLDLFSRRVVGWSLSASMDRSLVIDALQRVHRAARLADGSERSQSRSRSDSPQRPGEPVRERGFPEGIGGIRHLLQHESQGELLGQCPCGKLLWDAEARAGASVRLRFSCLRPLYNL